MASRYQRKRGKMEESAGKRREDVIIHCVEGKRSLRSGGKEEKASCNLFVA